MVANMLYLEKKITNTLYNGVGESMTFSTSNDKV